MPEKQSGKSKKTNIKGIPVFYPYHQAKSSTEKRKSKALCFHKKNVFPKKEEFEV